jgi:ribosomal protein S18 acetylase RimI-like enzyme
VPVAVVVLDLAAPRVAARVVEVQRGAYGVEAELIGYDEIPPLLETVEEVAGLDLVVLGARAEVGDDGGGELVGILGYRRDGDVVDVDRLAVDPQAFRQGIARTLLEALHTREADAARFEVSTGAANQPALALYRSFDYRVTHHEQLPGLVITHLVRPGP